MIGYSFFLVGAWTQKFDQPLGMACSILADTAASFRMMQALFQQAASVCRPLPCHGKH